MNRSPLIFGLFLALAFLLPSCFEEDQPVPPYVPPDNVISVALQNSMYTHQAYFDLDAAGLSGENENHTWELSFEAAPEGSVIRLNTANYWGIAHTASTNFQDDYSGVTGLDWVSDKSNGNPDSTAVGQWMTSDMGDTLYTREVMLLGQFDGISYQASKKLQFIHVDSVCYRFLVGNLDNALGDTLELSKNYGYQQIRFSLASGDVVPGEPLLEEWDLLFTQYHTILYTDDGQPTPYFVRGVLSQAGRVEVALDTLMEFNALTREVASGLQYSDKADALGHDWKGVTIDEASNSAEYRVRPGYTYLIRIHGETYYKLRFKSYYNDQGQKGFASFEYALLGP